MDKKLKRIFCFITLLLSFSLLTYADVKLKGEISGVIVDEEGVVLPGVPINLTGENLFQKNLSMISSNKGSFRFINLNPGSYELEFKLSGFNTLKILNVRVSVGKETPIRATLTLIKLKEEVIVTAEAPLIETKTTQISTNFTTAIIEKIPTSRNLIDLTEAVPGLNDRGAYGAGGITDGDYVRGSNTSNYTLNGVDIASISRGDTWVNPAYETIDEIQVIGIGASAEYGNFTGASVNVITKSGSNEFHGGLSFFYTDSRLYGDNSEGIIDLKPGDIKYYPEAVAYLGGPLIKEKLFFFLSGGYTGKKAKISYASVEYAILKQPHAQLRLDWLANAKNTFTLMVNTDPLNHDNLGLLAGSGPEIAYSSRFRSTAIYASWQSIFSKRAFFDIKYAGFKGKKADNPVSPDAISIIDRARNRRYGSSGLIVDRYSNRDQVNAATTYYADEFLGASHEFKFGLEYEKSSFDEDIRTTGKGGLFYVLPYPGDLFGIVSMVGYYMHTVTYLTRISAFAQDNIRIGKKVTLNLGLRYDNPKVTAKDFEGTVAKYSAIAPRIGLSYDFGGDAKNVLHFHYGRYYNKLCTFAFSQSLPGMQNIDYYALFVDKAFEPTPENIANLPSLVNRPENYLYSLTAADPIPVKKLNGPYTDVFNIGFEKVLFRNFALSIDYIHKRDRDFFLRDTHTKHTWEEVQWTDPWLGKTHTLWSQGDTLPDEWYIRNSPWAKRNHNFFIITLRKREIGRWLIMTSYTYQKSEGNVSNSDGEMLAWGNRGADSDPNFYKNDRTWGLLEHNRTHQFKLMGSYHLSWGFSISGDLRLLSGRNWNSFANFFQSGIYYPKQQGPGIFLETRGSQRMPTKKMLNLRIAKIFRLGAFSNLELSVDILNAFNDADAAWYYSNPTDVYGVSGKSAFGKPIWLGSPRKVQLGVRWTF